jgi:hypothetical protein
MIKYSPLVDDPDGYRWVLDEDYVYYSKTFNRTKTLKKGMKSDGATFVRDLGAPENGWRKYWAMLISWLLKNYLGKWVVNYVTNKTTAAWFVHDAFCVDPYWDDEYPVSNFIASTILSCILYTDGYKIESILWWWGTFLFGGKNIKNQVGWLYVKETV